MSIINDIAVLSPKAAQVPDGEESRLERITIASGDRYVLNFAAGEELIWTIPSLSDGYQNGDLNLEVFCVMESATSGDVILNAYVEAISNADSLDLDSTTSFDSINTSTTAVAGTAGHLFKVTITLTNKDGVAVGDHVRIKLVRDASDVATGNLRVLGGKLKEAVTTVDLTGATNVTVTALNSIPSATLAYLDATSSIQDQLDALSSVGTDTLTSASTVNLDFSSVNNAKLSIGHDVTFTTSNRASSKAKTLTIFGHASNSYNLAYPSDWKNCGGTSLPAAIAANVVYQFNFNVFGTAETDVVVEYVNGSGVDFALTASGNVQCYKSSSVACPAISAASGGPNRGFIYMTVNATIGTFTTGLPPGNLTSTIDGDTGRYTAITGYFAFGVSNIVTYLSPFTWYPPQSGGFGVPGTGTMVFGLSDSVESASVNITVTAYGDDEVQQLEWTNTGSPTAPVGGRFTLTHSGYGTTAAIDASGGTGAIQSALTNLMGAAAPTVGGSATTTTFTYSNGVLAHTDTAELTVGAGTPEVHDSSGNAGFLCTQTQTGDNSTQPDIWSGTWDTSYVGKVTFNGVDINKLASGGSSTTLTLYSVIWTLTDVGNTFTLTAPDFTPYGSISSTPDIGFALIGTMSTLTAGNS